MLLGGYVGQEQMEFGQKALRLPARNAPEATVRVVRQFSEQRQAGEDFRGWIERSGGVKTIADTLRDLDFFPVPRRRPRVLRRLRRDRALRRRDRRFGVRDMTNATVFTGAGGDGLRQPAQVPRGLHRRRPGRAERRVRAPAGHQGDPVGRRQLRAPPGPDRVDDRRRAHRPRRAGLPGHRGRVHRHRLPLPRDARDRRGGAAPLRAQHEDHDRGPPGRGAVEGRPGELLLGGEGRPARPGPAGQVGVDERPAPQRGRHPGQGAARGPRPARASSR